MDNLLVNVIEPLAYVFITVFAGFITKNVHDKNKVNKIKNAINLTEKFAKDVDIALSQRTDMTNSEKFRYAFRFVSKKVEEEGLHVSPETISNKVIAVYQMYKASGGDIHKFATDVTEETVNDASNAYIDTIKNIDKDITTPESRMIEKPTNAVQVNDAKDVEDNNIKIDEPKTAKQENTEDNKQITPENPYIR